MDTTPAPAPAPAPTPIKSILRILNSKRDYYGNYYWAFEFIDCATGKSVLATASSGPSNIELIRRYYDPALKDWDRTMRVETQELPIRAFNAMTKTWPHAGCCPEELAEWVRQALRRA